MQFFEYQGTITNEKWAEENDDRNVLREKVRRIAVKSSSFNQKLQNKFFFVTDASEILISIGIICEDSGMPEKKLAAYLNAIEIELKDTSLEEITLNSVRNMLRNSERSGYIDDDDNVLERFDLDKISGYRDVNYGENMIETETKKAIYEKANRFLARDTLIPELDRIYAGNRKVKAAGHPVHYMVQTDDHDTRREMYRLLLQALYASGRIQNKRYVFMDICPGEQFSKGTYEYLYKSCTGGTAVVRYAVSNDMENDFASCERETIEILCEVMKKYRNQVLTVFCLPRENSRNLFYENLGSISFIELKEEFASGERAENFLKMLARNQKIRTDQKLFSMLEEDRGYLASDLHTLFDEWYNNKLKTDIYPQYKESFTARKKIQKAEPKGSAYDELMGMTGLAEVKKVINQALNYYKAQKLFAEKGMKSDRPAMHMVFTGNPGTAKTTAARLFASIMKENNLLSKGRLIEVGRGDLVGKYVGWTAPAIQKKFEEASGSVLFIDEAYSLVDDRDGSFGDEAINTIVQEMENHRDDVVVIFAGYPDKMEKFLQKNPGLRSRITYHVPFADYSTEELCEIAHHIGKKKDICFTADADDKLKEVFEAARAESDFGNGRYVRNVIEKARMAQAERLVLMDYDSVTGKDIATICGEDIEVPVKAGTQYKTRIGFCA